MNAFNLEPTQSREKVVNWVFTRSVLIFVFAFYGALFARDLLGPFSSGFVVAFVVIIATRFWCQILFRGIDAYLEGKGV